MRNYSFILASPTGSEQLYRIGQFPDFEHAFCLAELIASELSIDPNGQWTGWTIEVQDGEDSLVFAVPVDAGFGGGLHMTIGAFEANASPKAA